MGRIYTLKEAEKFVRAAVASMWWCSACMSSRKEPAGEDSCPSCGSTMSNELTERFLEWAESVVYWAKAAEEASSPLMRFVRHSDFCHATIGGCCSCGLDKLLKT